MHKKLKGVNFKGQGQNFNQIYISDSVEGVEANKKCFENYRQIGQNAIVEGKMRSKKAQVGSNIFYRKIDGSDQAIPIEFFDWRINQIHRTPISNVNRMLLQT